jgi:hypothetical protein
VYHVAQLASDLFHRRLAEDNMIDLLYIALTLLAFAALIGYVRACALLGREDSVDSRGKDER